MSQYKKLSHKLKVVATINVALSLIIGLLFSLIAPCGRRAQLISDVCTNGKQPMTLTDGILFGFVTGLFLTLFFGLFISILVNKSHK